MELRFPGILPHPNGVSHAATSRGTPLGFMEEGVIATQGAPAATLGFTVQRRWRKGW